MSNLCEVNGHIGKVSKTEYELIDGDVKERVSLWGCTRCPETSTVLWPDFGQVGLNKDHNPDDADCWCFGCKIRTLEMNAGDARIANSGTTNKKWDKELQSYRDARAQGIQPAGTTTQAVRAALEISNKTGKAFNADNPNG